MNSKQRRQKNRQARRFCVAVSEMLDELIEDNEDKSQKQILNELRKASKEVKYYLREV